MITPADSARIFQLVTKPTPGAGQPLVDKLQRLVLEHPRVASQLEHLCDVWLAPAGGGR